jgi:hypothetical protein
VLARRMRRAQKLPACNPNRALRPAIPGPRPGLPVSDRSVIPETRSMPAIIQRSPSVDRPFGGQSAPAAPDAGAPFRVTRHRSGAHPQRDESPTDPPVSPIGSRRPSEVDGVAGAGPADASPGALTVAQPYVAPGRSIACHCNAMVTPLRQRHRTARRRRPCHDGAGRSRSADNVDVGCIVEHQDGASWKLARSRRGWRPEVGRQPGRHDPVAPRL